MAFQLSPGVRVREIDLTNIVPAVSTSIAGFAGFFRWGPINEIVTVSSEKEMAAIFGTPDDSSLHSTSFFTAGSYLKYSNVLRIIRAGNHDDTVGVSGYSNATDMARDTAAPPIFIPNYEVFQSLSNSSKDFSVAARYAGKLGNSITVIVFNDLNFDDAGLAEYANEFDTAPDSNEIHVLVLDSTGDISGIAGTILEKWNFLSTVEGTKNQSGANAYYLDVINERSNWIYFGNEIQNDLDQVVDTEGLSNSLVYNLTGAVDLNIDEQGGGDTVREAESTLRDALDLFNDSETVDIDMLFSIWTFDPTYNPSGNNKDNIGAKLDTIANERKDIVAFVSPPRDVTVPYQGNVNELSLNSITTDLIGWGSNYNSSYVVLDSSALYVYDKYNDKYRWIPASGHVAGLCANTDAVADPWFSPAGLNRGVLRGVIKVAYNPNKTRRDDLYKIGINPITFFTGEGIVLFGDKTSLARPSAFDRINVRRLFLVLEKAISAAARFQLFEFNDQFTRAQFRSLVNPFLRTVQGRRGITDFLVVCDETNNPGDVIDRNEFVADIYIKPARSINFITLNFIATRTDANFQEIIGLTNTNPAVGS